MECIMATFKMIFYPFAFAIGAMCLVTLLGMAMFGLHSTDWSDWQNDLVGSGGTVAGLAAAVVGLWLAIRTERHAVQ
jgi:hypothetical protein